MNEENIKLRSEFKTFRVTKALSLRLKKAAFTEERTQGALMRRAVIKYLDDAERKSNDK